MNRTTLFFSIFMTVSFAAGLTMGLVGSAPSSAVATAPNSSLDLGPADALVLTGTPDVRVVAVGGRPAWGQQAATRSYGIATVDIGATLTALTASDRYAKDLKVFEEELEAKGEDFQKRWMELQERIANAGEDSPPDASLDRDMQAFRKEAEGWNRQMERKHSELLHRQYEQAWGEIRSALDVVAERAGADIVIKGTPPSDPFTKGDIDHMIQQVRSRTLVRVPEGIDLTDDLLKELNVTRVSPEDQVDDAADDGSDAPVEEQ